MADARVLTIRLGDVTVGHITGFQDGRSLFAFDDRYIDLGARRPTLSLSCNSPGDEATTAQLLQRTQSARMRLPAFFSNLLPEGVLREYVVKRLKIHHDHEFDLFAALGESLPGAVRAIPADGRPPIAVDAGADATRPANVAAQIKFSLGGSQLKFSMIERGGRFTLADGNDEWIVKPPNPRHPGLPANEYTMMRLAAAAGVQTPEVRLVKLQDVDLGDFAGGLIPHWETWAYAIKRYDRTPAGRVHVEDFAQVFDVYGDQQYKAANYDTIGRLIFDRFPDRFEQLAEFVRRLVVNVLIGNGDAHLKNWSLIYGDTVLPALAPAYDLVSTVHYMRNDSLALNLAGTKRFVEVDAARFERLARRVGAPPKFVLDVVEETVDAARGEWPGILSMIGPPEDLREGLYAYWRGLSPLMRILN